MSASDKSYGILYNPRTLPSVKKLSLNDLGSYGIRYIRLQWNDLTNLTRYRVIPFNSFVSLLSSPRPGIGVTKACLGLINLSLAEGFTGTGEYLYVPDMDTLRICPYAPGHASVMGWFQEKEAINGGESFNTALCPRGLLKRIVDDAKTAGVEFLIGVETEFILLKSTDPIEAVHDAPWSTSAALPSGTVVATVLEEIADAIQGAGIELLMYHAEGAPGQYEVVTAPLSPLEAADALIVTREVIYNIAAKHGLRATLAPRVFPTSCGSAAHTHISVHHTSNIQTKPPSPNPNTNSSTTMTPLERSFLQSLLDHLPSIAALTLPTVASYARVEDGVWSGGTYPCWGRDNRESLVRLTGAPGKHHFEVRSIDGTASPYIALAGILGVGMKGVWEGRELVIKECEGMASELTEKERKGMGIVGRMPRVLSQARMMLEDDKVVRKVVGDEFIKKYLAVNVALETSLLATTPEEEMKKLVQSY